jgi:alanine-alpha-ketoisovalerate/valine-pyruvate aminotransferase
MSFSKKYLKNINCEINKIILNNVIFFIFINDCFTDYRQKQRRKKLFDYSGKNLNCTYTYQMHTKKKHMISGQSDELFAREFSIFFGFRQICQEKKIFFC